MSDEESSVRGLGGARVRDRAVGLSGLEAHRAGVGGGLRAARGADDRARGTRSAPTGRLGRAAAELHADAAQGRRGGGRGRGRNVLGGPIQALRFLVEEIARYPVNAPIGAGEIVTTGTLTDAQPARPGESGRRSSTGSRSRDQARLRAGLGAVAPAAGRLALGAGEELLAGVVLAALDELLERPVLAEALHRLGARGGDGGDERGALAQGGADALVDPGLAERLLRQRQRDAGRAVARERWRRGRRSRPRARGPGRGAGRGGRGRGPGAPRRGR